MCLVNTVMLLIWLACSRVHGKPALLSLHARTIYEPAQPMSQQVSSQRDSMSDAVQFQASFTGQCKCSADGPPNKQCTCALTALDRDMLCHAHQCQTMMHAMKNFAGFSCPITGNIHQHHHIHGGSLLLLQQEIRISLTCDATLQGRENEGTNPDPGPWPQEICLRDCACSSQQHRQHLQRSSLLHLVAHSNPEAAESM